MRPIIPMRPIALALAAACSLLGRASAASDVLEPGQPLDQRIVLENPGAAPQTIQAAWTLRADPGFYDTAAPDPVLGVDHALGATNTLVVDGRDMGDARLCDGDLHNPVELPWGKGYKEAVVTLDLGLVRNVTALRWMAGDANWIWKTDISAAGEDSVFKPVEGAQGFDMHGRWAGPHSFPWPGAVAARRLRFRFHHDGETANTFRLPPAVMVYDGAANDPVALPQTGPVLDSGTAAVEAATNGAAELVVKGTVPLAPGACLLGLDLVVNGRKQVRWSSVFVRPSTTVDTARTGRFGINSADPAVAAEMRRCGFGWVRFENAKWMMFCTARDRFGFDGSVAPWHVNCDAIFAGYQKLGMKVLPYVFQPPEWASSAPADQKRNRAGYPPKDPADYGEAVFQLVARHGSAVVPAERLLTVDKKSALGTLGAVELWNEPNLNDPGWGPFVGPIEKYFDAMRAGAEGSRRADPSLPVSAAGWAGMGLEVVNLLAEHKYADGKSPLDLIDIVNVHFYSGREEPEICGWDPNVDRQGPSSGGATYPDQLEDLVAWRDALKPKAQLWLSETGNDVGGPIGRTERHQASKVPRAVMLALAAGIEKVFIYRETGSAPTMHAGAGLLRDDRSVRPVWFTTAAMIRQLEGFQGRALRLPSSDPAAWVFLWQDGSRRLLAAWTRGGTWTLPAALGPASVCDAFGRTRPVAEAGGLAVTDMPLYVSLSAPGPGFEAWVAEGRKEAAARLAARAALAAAPARVFDFGPPGQQLGMLKGYGMPRRFTAAGKNTVWAPGQGYGFVRPALSEETRPWVSSALGPGRLPG